MPETRYTRSGDVNIAYQVIGDGPIDLVLVHGWVSHVELQWDHPSLAGLLRRLSSFSRLIVFDKRGTGLSDRVSDSELPTMEQRMDDVRAVMEAAKSQRAAVMGFSEGGPLCALFAATYPERTTALVMIASYARRMWAPDYPWGPHREEWQRFIDWVKTDWGDPIDVERRAPSMLNDDSFREWWSKYLRSAASPGAAASLTVMNSEIDIRHVLPAIRVPTLILHREGDALVDPGGSRYMASQIPGARFVSLPGADHLPWVGDVDGLVGEVEEFLTGVRHAPEVDRVLATVLFTDIVDSTQSAATVGDKNWKELLQGHNDLMAKAIDQWRGRLVKSTGDGVLATFDGPGRAIRCAASMVAAVKPLGLRIRAGLHTGECELLGDDISGISVNIAARVSSLAQADEVLASRTVKDLVAGSDIEFEERGTHSLKGVPGDWEVFAARV
jgi:class 3 adenylate cyclase